MPRCRLLAAALLVAPLAGRAAAQSTEYDLIYLRPPGENISNIYPRDMDSYGNVLLKTTTQYGSADPGGT
jgi:hypothetical protein